MIYVIVVMTVCWCPFLLLTDTASRLYCQCLRYFQGKKKYLSKFVLYALPCVLRVRVFLVTDLKSSVDLKGHLLFCRL